MNIWVQFSCISIHFNYVNYACVYLQIQLNPPSVNLTCTVNIRIPDILHVQISNGHKHLKSGLNSPVFKWFIGIDHFIYTQKLFYMWSFWYLWTQTIQKPDMLGPFENRTNPVFGWLLTCLLFKCFCYLDGQMLKGPMLIFSVLHLSVILCNWRSYIVIIGGIQAMMLFEA